MTLEEYFQKKGAPSVRQFAKRCGVSYTTVKNVRRGMKVKLYEVAKAISEATKPAPEKRPLVTIEDLCGGEK